MMKSGAGSLVYGYRRYGNTTDEWAKLTAVVAHGDAALTETRWQQSQQCHSCAATHMDPCRQIHYLWYVESREEGQPDRAPDVARAAIASGTRTGRSLGMIRAFP